MTLQFGKLFVKCALRNGFRVLEFRILRLFGFCDKPERLCVDVTVVVSHVIGSFISNFSISCSKKEYLPSFFYSKLIF